MLFSYISIVGSEIVLLVAGQKLDVERGMYFRLEYIEICFWGILQKKNKKLHKERSLGRKI